MKIEYYTKNVYGIENIYIKGDLAHTVQVLTRRKTITREDMKALEALGIEFIRTFEN